MGLAQHRRSALAVAVAVLVGAIGITGMTLLGHRSDPASDADGRAGTLDRRAATVPRAEHTTSTGPAATDQVIMPGRPGEPASVRGVDEAGAPTDTRHSPMDAAFVRMMIPHHVQALRMAAMAPDRAADPRIRALAERIRVSQVPEILRMRGWLDSHGLGPDDPTGDHDHDHGAMPGMQSDAAMRALAVARGAAFDRLFVQMMIDHHRGAIDMTNGVLRVGVDVTIRELATSIAAEQYAEIERMRDLLVP